MTAMLEAYEDGFADGLSGAPRRAPIGSTPKVRTHYNLAWFAGLNERNAREERRDEQPPTQRRAMEHVEARRSADRAEQTRAKKRRSAPKRSPAADDFIAEWRNKRGGR